MKYSIFSNIRYVYKASFEKCSRMKLLLFVDFITELAVPFFATAITSIVVYALTNNVDIETYVLIILGLSIFGLMAYWLRNWAYLTYTFENIFTRNSTFMIRLADHQLSTDYLNVEPKNKRKIISKAFEAIGSNMYGVELMMRNAPEAMYNLVGMLAYAVLIALYTPYILLVLGVMTVVNYFITKRANKFLSTKRDKIGKLWDEKYYLTKDSTNPKYGKDIRAYRLANWFNCIYVSLTKERKIIGKQTEKRFLFSNLSNTAFLLIRDLIAYVSLAVLVINGDIDLATFTFLIGIVTGFTLWLNGFVTSINNLRSSNIATNEYRECLRAENVFNHGEGVSISTLKKPLQIEFRDVSFKYPQSDSYVLKDLSFKTSPGEKIALVGENGAGKTTIVKLLCGLYKPTSGKILINNISMSEFNLEEYMKLLSAVFQDSEPLAFTVEQNISCSTVSDVNNHLVWDSLEKAGLKEKVESLEFKEKTYISQMFDKNGIRLSGGETQKLMLARAIYKDAALLVLDEPTAALDPISEEEMYLNYENLLKGNTSIFISHRLSSTKFCDRILYLKNGEIIEEGSHKDLMEIKGEYREVFDIQAQYYKEDDEDEEYQI